MEQVNLPVEIDALSVYRALEHIEDGRHKRGVRYSVALIFTLILLAKGAGMTTPLAIAQWVRRLRRVAEGSAADHAHTLSLCRDLPSCAASRGCPAGQRGADAGIEARDGKTLRGTDAAMSRPIRRRCTSWPSMKPTPACSSKSR
jgi:hypothetical protein